MKNTFGNNISITLFGESHGEAIGAILDGLPAGFEIDLDKLNWEMEKRKAKGKLSTRRHEADQVHFVSGFFEGKTTGTPLTILIENTNTRSQDYAQLKYRLRPGHADLAAFEKYNGYQDYRGGGHFSGRLTAPIVAAGAICRQILEAKGVNLATHIQSLHGISDDNFASNLDDLAKQMADLNQKEFPVLNMEASEKMVAEIEQASVNLDSVGGVLQTIVTGFPAGVGEPFFDSIESTISHLMFSIPAVKGISFGEGFGFANLYGSQANDPIIVQDGKIQTQTNRNGGINGGISNGMPIVFQTCIKPTPSIYQKQHSVNYQTKEEVILEIKGRHDPAIIHRARAVVDALCAFGLLDLWMSHQATTSFEA
ncbi:MAG: chorismate synthase [Erysipelotrichaceae bacterium]|nr:chorismate synthase [Erysipelotrichaceae bacterium]